MWKKTLFYILQILQTGIREKIVIKDKRLKTHVLFKNNQRVRISRQKEKHRQNYLI